MPLIEADSKDSCHPTQQLFGLVDSVLRFIKLGKAGHGHELFQPSWFDAMKAKLTILAA